MGKQLGFNKEVEKKKTLFAVMKKINSYWIDDLEVELGVDTVTFSNGMVWICENCNRIHVGFYLDTSLDFIGHMAIALSDFKDRVVFEQMAVFIEFDDVSEGEEAFYNYGKCLMDSVIRANHAPETIEIDETDSVQELEVGQWIASARK